MIDTEHLKLLIIAAIGITSIIITGVLALYRVVTGDQFIEIARYIFIAAVSLYAGYRIGMGMRK